jgi:D-glycero-D-manno-heptose 1,7-bisphosphate phosphatase
MAKAVFLDRDGVLNAVVVRGGKPYSPDTVGEMVIPSDAAEALGRLRAGGFRLVMVTNQPDVVRGRITHETVDAMNGHIQKTLSIDAVEVCLHDDADGCDCRKPKPGMLLRAAARDGIDLRQSFMVGDRWRDIEAGRAAGCRTILIGDGYAEGLRGAPDHVAVNLSDAANWILAHRSV